MEAIAPAIAVTVIATVWFGYLIVKMALQHEEKRLAMKGGGERVEQILAENQAEMANLRQRVQVLERLATDEDRRLAGEIAKLGTSETQGHG
jgi:hypothetical protein